MMDTSLKTESDKLNGVLTDLIKETENEYNEIVARIKELSVLLTEKEMQTDRTENASFQIAKDERDMKTSIGNLLLQKLEAMKTELRSYVPTGFITLGTTVELNLVSVDEKPPKHVDTHFIIKLVQHHTSNAKKRLVAIDSKVGSAIIGRRAGEVVKCKAPKGLLTYKIERIY